jgi:putative hydrolase of the HAD superfamily
MKIIIFDLDDTLIDEIKYVKSGFRHVSKKISNIFNSKKVEWHLNKVFRFYGRGKVFDNFFKEFLKPKQIDYLIKCYRQHVPDIKLKREARILLNKLQKKNISMYLVTDGDKVAQKKKIIKLSLNKYFKKIFITHEYGARNMKPSLYCFKKIKLLENISWKELVYIADNPRKDFINLNLVGAKTIRVLTGPYKHMKVPKNYDAQYKINSLKNFKLDFNEL